MQKTYFLCIFIFVFVYIPVVSLAQGTPVRIDIIVTADTTTPPFYGGRTLPSSGSTVTVTAVISSNAIVDSSKYLYIWEIDGKKQNNGIPSQSNKITVSPDFEKEITVRVTVTNSTGKTLGTYAQAIPIATPEIHFYEVNLLRGLSNRTLSQNVSVAENEITLQGERYYMSKNTQSLKAVWKQNGVTINTGAGSPFVITVTKEDGPKVTLSLDAHNILNILQNASQTLTLTF